MDRYQLILESKNGQQEFNASENLKTRPSKLFAKKYFGKQFKRGMRITLITKIWDEEYNEPYEISNKETLLNF